MHRSYLCVFWRGETRLHNEIMKECECDDMAEVEEKYPLCARSDWISAFLPMLQHMKVKDGLPASFKRQLQLRISTTEKDLEEQQKVVQDAQSYQRNAGGGLSVKLFLGDATRDLAKLIDADGFGKLT